MTDCGCDKASGLTPGVPASRTERPASSPRRRSEHLANCDDCTGEANVGLTLTQKLQKACQETAPDQLRAEILARDSTASAAARRPVG